MSWRRRVLGTVATRVREVSEFLNSNELAAITNVSRRTVDRWIAAGIPCSIRRRGVVRFNLDHARQWLADGPGVKMPPKRRGRPRNVDRG